MILEGERDEYPVTSLDPLFSAWALANQKSKDQEREFYSLKDNKALVREWQEDFRERDQLWRVGFNQALQAPTDHPSLL